MNRHASARLTPSHVGVTDPLNAPDGVRAALEQIRCLDGCGAEALGALAQVCGQRSCITNEVLFRQHGACRQAFALVQGAVKLSRDTGTGTETVLELASGGVLLGEHAPVMPVHPCSAITLCDSRMLTIPAAALDGLLQRFPDLGHALLAQLAERAETLMERARQQAHYSAQQLVASFLLRHSGEDGSLNLEVRCCSRRDLSALLSLRPETLSRVFGKLRRSGALRDRAGAGDTVDRAALAAILPQS